MSKSAAFRLAIVAIVLGTAGAAVAQEAPTLDYTALCRAEAKAAPTLAGPCEGDQKRAQQDLVRRWSEFTPAERSSCLQVVNSVAGMQSYIELLTCLEMKRDVRIQQKQ
jgi:hypothetical protein